MSTTFFGRITRLFAVIQVALLIGSCDYSRKTPGWQYFDDMAQSPAYETYSPNPVFADGKTMQPPVEGTIPRDFMPYPYEKSDEDRIKAGQQFTNSLELTSEHLERGRRMYDIYCAACHGINGDGLGTLYTSGKYAYPPASLLSDKMLQTPEGEIYHVITVGFGIMAEHGSMIRPDDRWKTVMYIQQVLQNQ